MNKYEHLHQPFAKPFWKLLGFSILSLLLVYGGIVWAVTKGDNCTEYSNGSTTAVGADVSNISGWTVVRKLCEIVQSNDSSEIEVKTANVDNKTIRITNTGSQDYFVPTRTDVELNAFLNARSRSTNPLPFTACEVGVDTNTDSVFLNNIKGCDTPGVSCVQDAVCTSDLDCGAGSCSDPLAFGSSNYCGGFYNISSAGNCNGSPIGNTKIDWNGSAFDWQYGYVYYVDNSENRIAAICGADAEIGDNIGVGVPPYPNNFTQCIIQDTPQNGTYYQVHQFTPGIDSWFQLTVSNSQVTAVSNLVVSGFGNPTQTCNQTNELACNGISGCSWESVDNKVSCNGPINQATCEIQHPNCTWSSSGSQTCSCTTNNNGGGNEQAVMVYLGIPFGTGGLNPSTTCTYDTTQAYSNRIFVQYYPELFDLVNGTLRINNANIFMPDLKTYSYAEALPILHPNSPTPLNSTVTSIATATEFPVYSDSLEDVNVRSRLTLETILGELMVTGKNDCSFDVGVWCGSTNYTCVNPYLPSDGGLTGPGGTYEWSCSASGQANSNELVALCPN